MQKTTSTVDSTAEDPKGTAEIKAVTKPIIAITAGDVAGIGPEIVLHTVQDRRVLRNCRPIIIGHPQILSRAARLRPTVGEWPTVSVSEVSNGRESVESLLATLPADTVPVVNPCNDTVLNSQPGEVSAASGAASFECLTTATQLALAGSVCGIATAPLNKEALHAAGHNYPGHTEILAAQCGVTEFAMMLHLSESRLQPLRKIFVSESTDSEYGGYGLSIAHVTLHTSIDSVPRLLTQDSIIATTILMKEFLKMRI